MARIVYLVFSRGGLSGGHKIILRHVEALRDLGFSAIARTGPINKLPTWFEHRAPVEVGTPFKDDDVLVVPSDALPVLAQAVDFKQRVVVFVQSLFDVAAESFEVLDRYPAERLTLIAAAPGIAAMLAKAYPDAQVELVPAFADERLFRPAAERQDAVAHIPRKRPLEVAAIRGFLKKLHPEWPHLPWRAIEEASEAETAAVMGSSSLFLSLGRLEGLGLTPLEAMSAGCVCAGFTGVGGRDFATPENGFWVPEDDCQAAAEALCQAADLTRSGGPALARYREASRATAAQWSYAAFLGRLEEVWTRLAPSARVQGSPLD
jgi:hypothetical protein